MLDSTTIKLATSKLASASVPYLPGTLILISGIVVWKLWRNQTELQAQTSKLNNELNNVKKQVADIKNDGNTASNKSDDPLSSALKNKAFNYLSKSATKWLSK